MPAVLIDRTAGAVVVDGRAVVGLDLSALPPGLALLRRNGAECEAEIDGRTVPVYDLADLQPVLAAHAARVAEMDAATAEIPVEHAVRTVFGRIDAHRAALQAATWRTVGTCTTLILIAWRP